MAPEKFRSSKVVLSPAPRTPDPKSRNPGTTDKGSRISATMTKRANGASASANVTKTSLRTVPSLFGARKWISIFAVCDGSITRGVTSPVVHAQLRETSIVVQGWLLVLAIVSVVEVCCSGRSTPKSQVWLNRGLLPAVPSLPETASSTTNARRSRRAAEFPNSSTQAPAAAAKRTSAIVTTMARRFAMN